MRLKGLALVTLTYTSQQLALRYDASNHLGITVASNGAVTYTATGSGAGHAFTAGISGTTASFSGAVSGTTWTGAGNATLSSADLGPGGSNGGRKLTVGRNSNGVPAPGYLELVDQGGTSRYLWVDNVTGNLLISTTEPRNSAAGTVVGTQS